MKQIILLLTTLIISISVFSQSKKVAILPVLDKNNEVSNMYKIMIRTAISKAINETKEYTALEREYEIS